MNKVINPYRNIEDYGLWSRAMMRPAPHQIDPCTRSKRIDAQDKVATIGSCFAQHLGRHIKRSGLSYYVPESGVAGMQSDELRRRNYGVFSARYGNIYTVRQLVQLFDRAYGLFSPVDRIWRAGDKLVDPFRPQIEPSGFATEAELESDREKHLGHVRDVFENTKFLIMTLGLTECWRSKRDGAVYPLAPGVAGGSFDPTEHEFVNFTAAELEYDLVTFLQKLRSVNSDATVVLTVSPVPLIATYERRHVLSSTTYSKAALRVAADAIEKKFSNVIYFPSYEIITSSATQGRYYDSDLRQVTELGVAHVMRVFSRHFFDDHNVLEKDRRPMYQSQSTDVICDEETIELSLRQNSG